MNKVLGLRIERLQDVFLKVINVGGVCKKKKIIDLRTSIGNVMRKTQRDSATGVYSCVGQHCLG